VREWLSNQASGGYVSYDVKPDAFYLTPSRLLRRSHTWPWSISTTTRTDEGGQA
jgi:hypothetical protein